MKLINCKKLTVAMLLIASSFHAYAELKAGDTLSFGDGSKMAMEVSSGFWVDTAIQARKGLVMGEAQTDKSIDAPFQIFEQSAQHLSRELITLIDSNATSAQLDFSSWAMAWRDAVINLGTSSGNEGDDGVAVVNCVNSCSKGETFTLDYSATLPADVASLGGLAYRLHLVGIIE